MNAASAGAVPLTTLVTGIDAQRTLPDSVVLPLPLSHPISTKSSPGDVSDGSTMRNSSGSACWVTEIGVTSSSFASIAC